jgi:multidrug efflux system membrane fusion protein
MRRLILLILLAGCSTEQKKPFEMPPIPVETASVKVSDVPLYFEAMGTIKPSQTADVKSQVSGIITGVHFEEGQWIEKGSLLYSIDQVPYRIRVKEVEAQLAQNSAHVQNGQKKLERYKSLSNPSFVALVEWDELLTKIALHEAMVRADTARLEAAKLDLERCQVVAPISGKSGKTALQVGSMTSPDLLVTLSQMDPLYVDFSMTPSERQSLPEDTTIEIYLSGQSFCSASGKITFVDHTIDKKTGMIAARGLLSEIKQPLWAEQSVRVHVHFGNQKGAMLIPLRAIKTNQTGPYVFLVKEDKTVELRPVKLGPEDHGLVVVDLDGGKVVTEGHMRLFPGAKVEEAP